ncbi:MAG: HEAT repeat domain-containing protein [Planctomycetota bacterium]
MLPNPQLKADYDKVIWVYVYRDFSHNKEDRAAERISLRFGVTSWPQLFLAHPESMKILAHTGRSVKSFQAAVERTRVPRRMPVDAWKKLTAAEERAIALEGKPKLALASKRIDDEDIVVRTRALSVLAAKKPDAVVARAVELLQTPNDPFRYEVCKVLQKAADKKAARALEALVKDPKESLNPNVLRIRAVQALATCGDAESVAVIAPHAQSGAYFNGLTGISVDALAKIAKRHKKAAKAVDEVLKRAYPPLPPDADDKNYKRAMRACVALAKRVHTARGAKRSFPKDYSEAARQDLMR